MVHCFVPDCSHNSEREDCSFYRFPRKNEAIKRKWIVATRRKDVNPTPSSRICSCHFVDQKKNNGPTIFPWNTGSPPSQKKYVSITVDSKHCNPAQASNIRWNRFVPILPRPSRTPISINHNAVPKDHQNKEQPTPKVMEPSDKIVPFEPEIILKIDNNATLTCLEETGEKLDKNVNDSDDSSCNTNDFKPLSSEEILKQKLEDMTALYEKTRKKLKISQEQCKHYAKQVMSLEEIIDNLRQIISVSDFN